MWNALLFCQRQAGILGRRRNLTTNTVEGVLPLLSNPLSKGCPQCPVTLTASLAKSSTASKMEGVLPRSWLVSSVEGVPPWNLAMCELTSRTNVSVTRFVTKSLTTILMTRVEGVLPPAREPDRHITALQVAAEGVPPRVLFLSPLVVSSRGLQSLQGLGSFLQPPVRVSTLAMEKVPLALGRGDILRKEDLSNVRVLSRPV